MLSRILVVVICAALSGCASSYVPPWHALPNLSGQIEPFPTNYREIIAHRLAVGQTVVVTRPEPADISASVNEPRHWYVCVRQAGVPDTVKFITKGRAVGGFTLAADTYCAGRAFEPEPITALSNAFAS